MGTFLAADLAVWLAVVFYVGRMGIRQRRVERALDALRGRTFEATDNRKPPAKAA